MKRYCKRIKENVTLKQNGNLVCTNHGHTSDCSKSRCIYSMAQSYNRLTTGKYDNEKYYATDYKKGKKETFSDEFDEGAASKAILESLMGVSPKKWWQFWK